MLRISVEEHGYLFHRHVQDPLTANLTAIENILSFNLHEKIQLSMMCSKFYDTLQLARNKRQLSRISTLIPVYDSSGNFWEEYAPLRSTKIYQFLV